jgi:hypothetical protein
METTSCDSDNIQIKNKLGMVTYTTKDGITHHGNIYHDGQKIISTNDTKLGTQVFANTLQWVNALDEFLPVSISTMQLCPNVNATASDMKDNINNNVDRDIDDDIDDIDDNIDDIDDNIDDDIDDNIDASFIQTTDNRPGSPMIFCEFEHSNNDSSLFNLQIPVNTLSAPLFTEDVNKRDLIDDDFHELDIKSELNKTPIVHYQCDSSVYSVDYNANNGDFDY